jgi:hypothetical protein
MAAVVPAVIGPNEGPKRIQYQCLNYNVRSPNFYIHVRVSSNYLYIPRNGLPILPQPNRQTDPKDK